jgi:hypothetical protein
MLLENVILQRATSSVLCTESVPLPIYEALIRLPPYERASNLE